MRKLTVLGAATLLLTGLVAGPAMAEVESTPTPSPSWMSEQVCPDYNGTEFGGTAKEDTDGEPDEVSVTAPDGKLISGYCVKAGSASSGGGAVYIEVVPPTKTVTITYPWGDNGQGKAISHYSVVYVNAPTPSASPSTSVSPSVTPTPSPSGSTSTSPSPSPSASTPGTTSSESPSGTATPSAKGSQSPSASPSTTVAGAVAGQGGPLAQTGPAGAITLTVLALALVGGGAALMVYRKRQAAAAK